MKQTQATRRLGEQLREKLGYILLFEVSDPRLDLVTLTAVEVAVDRSFARDRSTDEAERITRALENVPATLAIEKDEDGYPIADAAQEAALDD